MFRLELQRVDEAWRILDRYAALAWPGWKNNTNIPFRIDYPNGVSLYIGKPASIGRWQMFDSTLMKLVDSTLLRGKKIYLDESRKNTIQLTSRLAPGGGGAGLGGAVPNMNIRRLILTDHDVHYADSVWKASGCPPWPKEMSYSTDNQIAILVHELFHCYTNFGPGFSIGDTLFSADLNYAIFSEIEGELIEKAANETDTARMKDLLVQFLQVRKQKRRSMSPKQQAYESDQEKAEGIATYATDRIINLLSHDYEPLLSSKEDPLYFGFRYVEYFSAQNLDMFHRVNKSTLQTGAKAYGTGYFICNVLDKMLPDWKHDFFQRSRSMDSLIVQLSTQAARDTAGMLEKIIQEYHYAELEKRHSRVIGSRDSIITVLSDPKLKSFAIQYGEVSMMPIPLIRSTGAVYSRAMKYYYAPGSGSIQLGDMNCQCREIPMCLDIHTKAIILPDVDGTVDTLHYELHFNAQEAEDTYGNVTISGQHFTLRAPRVKIVKTSAQVQFVILPVKQ
ncbi:MAG TPA: hypothetical protein VK141_03055 [Nitrosomonas sp.]|nr:hypothetical protein [Nitrosomonas sp.]